MAFGTDAATAATFPFISDHVPLTHSLFGSICIYLECLQDGEEAEKRKLEEETAAAAEADLAPSDDTDTEIDDVVLLKQSSTILPPAAKDVISTAHSNSAKKRETILYEQLVAQDSIGRDDALQRLNESSINKTERAFHCMHGRRHFITRAKLKNGTKALSKRKLRESKGGGSVTVNSIDKNRSFLSSKSSEEKGFYVVQLPVTKYGLLINITSFNGGAAFNGYRKTPSGKAGPAEQSNLMRRLGDKIVSVNGKDCKGMSFREVVEVLVKASAGEKDFCQLRMQDKLHYC